MLSAMNSHRTESRMVVARASREGKQGVVFQLVLSFSYAIRISSRYLQHSIIPKVNNIVLCT